MYGIRGVRALLVGETTVTAGMRIPSVTFWGLLSPVRGAVGPGEPASGGSGNK